MLLCNYSLNAQLLLSHNDYEQKTPLHHALEVDCDIIEADIFLRDSTIVICHDEDDLDLAPTLLDTYILPLNHYNMAQLKGKMLMLDIKKYDQYIIERINNLRLSYPKLFDNITILLSGDFDRELVFNLPLYSALKIDGRIHLTNSHISIEQMPIISIKITDICSWNGCRRITQSQAQKLKSVIDQVHSSGRKIRFWSVADNPQSWNVLRALGVDIIGVDNLTEYAQYKSNTF